MSHPLFAPYKKFFDILVIIGMAFLASLIVIIFTAVGALADNSGGPVLGIPDDRGIPGDYQGTATVGKGDRAEDPGNGGTVYTEPPPLPDPNSFLFWVPCDNDWQPGTECSISEESISKQLEFTTLNTTWGGEGMPAERVAAAGKSWGVDPNQAQMVKPRTADIINPLGGITDDPIITWSYVKPGTGATASCSFIALSYYYPCALPTSIQAQTCAPVFDGIDARNGQMMATGRWFKVTSQKASVYSLVDVTAVRYGSPTSLSMKEGPESIETQAGPLIHTLARWGKVGPWEEGNTGGFLSDPAHVPNWNLTKALETWLSNSYSDYFANTLRLQKELADILGVRVVVDNGMTDYHAAEWLNNNWPPGDHTVTKYFKRTIYAFIKVRSTPVVNGEQINVEPGSCTYPNVTTEPLYCFYNYSGYAQWSGNRAPAPVAGPNTGSSLVTGGGAWTSTPHIHTGTSNSPPGSISWWQPASGNTAGVLGWSRSTNVSPYGYVSKANGAGGTYDPWGSGYWDSGYVHSSPTYATGYDTATPWQNNDCDTYRSEVLTYTLPGTSSLDDSRITSLGYYALTAQWQSDTFRKVTWSAGGRTLMQHWDLMSRNDVNSNTNYFVRTCDPAYNNSTGTGNIYALSNSISGLANPFSIGACGANSSGPGTSHWQCELVSPTIAGTYAEAVAQAVNTNSSQAETWAAEGWNVDNTNPLWLSSTVTSRDSSIVPVTFSKLRVMDYNTPNPSLPPIDVTNGVEGYALSFTKPVNSADIAGAAPGIYYATRVKEGSTPYNTKVDINDKAQFFHLWSDSTGSTQEHFNDPTLFPANANLNKWLTFVWDSDYNWGTNENQPYVIQRTYTVRGWFKLTDSGSLGSGTGSVAVGSGGDYWYYGESPCLDYNQTDGSNPDNYDINPDGTWRSSGILAATSNQIYVTRGQNNSDSGKLPNGSTGGYPANPISYAPPSPLGTGGNIGGANGPGFGVTQLMPQGNDVLYWNAISCAAGVPQYQVRQVLHNTVLTEPLVTLDGITTSSDGMQALFSIPTTSDWWTYGAKLGFQVRARCGFDTGQAGNWGEWSPNTANGYVYTTMVPKPTGEFSLALVNGTDNKVTWANSNIACLAGQVQYKAIYSTKDGVSGGTTVLTNWGTATETTINDPTYKGVANGVTVSARCHIANVTDLVDNELVSQEFKWTPTATWTANTHSAAWQNRVYAGENALYVIAYCSASPGAANSANAPAPATKITWSGSVWSALGWTAYSGTRTDQTSGTSVIPAPTSVLNIGSPYSGYTFSASCSLA